jgi:biopolymer transport protein ExbD
MIFKTYSDIAKGRIDPAPMVDVVFLLLIFFVLSSSFVMQPGFHVDLQPSKLMAASPYQGLVVTITRENILFFNEQRTTMEGLQKALKEAGRRGQDAELIIKADKQVAHGTVVEIMSMATEAGITAVNIATRPVAPESAGAVAPR